MKRPQLFAIAMTFVLIGCDDVPPPEPTVDAKEEAITPTVLGEQLVNPYSLRVMRQAWDELDGVQGGLKSAIAEAISATHLYVRFAPADSAELFDLLADTTLEVFDYPMDREVLSWGEGYHAPELPDSVPTYHYCAVPIDMELPGITYAVLDSLYQPDVPEDDVEESANSLKAAPILDFDRLERQAFQVAGLEEGLKRSQNYRPHGYLKYEDTSRGSIEGVEGAKLRFHYFTKVTTCRTNNQGYFYGGKTFRRDPHCEVRWECDDFVVRPSTGLKVAETHLTGDEKRQFVCRSGTNAWKYASVYRGAHYYYHQWYIGGLTRPPRWGLRHVLIKAVNTFNKLGRYYCASILGLVPDIRVLVSDRSSAQIFGTVVHELAHVVHHQKDRSNYHHCDDIVKETWARGVQWYMLTQRYGAQVTAEAVSFKRNGYTGLVRDLIDGKFATKHVGDHSYADRVTGFSIKQVEDIVVGGRLRSWSALGAALKDKYNGSDSDLDALLAAWAD